MNLNQYIEDKPLQEKCGIVGLFSTKPQSLIRPALIAAGGVQHRGQHGAGITFYKNNKLIKFTGDGLLREIFTKDVVKKLDFPSNWFLVHCRYGTNGGYIKHNLQPCVGVSKNMGKISVVHNGELPETSHMKSTLLKNYPEGISDTYIFTQYLASLKASSWEEKIIKALEKSEGAYSFIFGVENCLYAARDKSGIRPLILGTFKDTFMLASETHAFDKLGAKVVRQLEKGEILKIDKNGVKTIKKDSSRSYHFCDFEWAYFARPDSLMSTNENKDSQKKENWMSVSRFRQRCGTILASEKPIKHASFVVGLPDSGLAIAAEYANTLDLPYKQVIIRDHFDVNGSHRLFMKDDHIKKIKKKVLGKLSLVPDRQIWKDAIVVIGDDSIVRGNVSKEITRAVFALGAKEVHWIVGFPPVKDHCHLGVSLRTKEELVANETDGTPEHIAKSIGATSVNYISNVGFVKAKLLSSKPDIPSRREEIFLRNGSCGGCLTGVYPINKDGSVFKI